jgi:hypothetical protein
MEANLKQTSTCCSSGAFFDLQHSTRQITTVPQETFFAVAMLLLFHFSKNTLQTAYLLFKD